MSNQIPTQISARYVALAIDGTGWVDDEADWFSPIVADEIGPDLNDQIDENIFSSSEYPGYIGIFKLVEVREVQPRNPEYKTVYLEPEHKDETSSTKIKLRRVNDSRLTPRLNQVATLIAHKNSHTEIARHLGIKPNSVRRYANEITNRTGVWEFNFCDLLQ